MSEETYIHQLLEPDQVRVTGYNDYSVNRICQVLDRIAAGNAKRFPPLPPNNQPALGETTIWDETNSGSGESGPGVVFYQHPETIHLTFKTDK